MLIYNLRTLDRMNMNNKILKLDLTKLTSLREQNMKRNQFFRNTFNFFNEKTRIFNKTC